MVSGTSKKVSTDDIAAYLRTRNVVVVDESTSSRTLISRVLVELGAIEDQIFLTKSYKEAQKLILGNRPQIILAEFNIQTFYGLDLLSIQRSYLKDNQDRLFMLVTTNASDSAIAEAAEEEVDAYILKPYSFHKLNKYFLKTISHKISPSEYYLAIQDGKRLIKEEKIKEAKAILEKATSLHSSPCLAYYYLALASEKTNQLTVAIDEYKKGLRFNPIHYKCLVGEFETLDKLKKRKEAYEVIQRIVQHFPISPQRLGKIFSLAVYTHNFTDVERHYELFKNLERRPKDLGTLVSAGMTVCGKFLLTRGEFQQAIEVFKKAAYATGNDPQFLAKIIRILLEEKKPREAELFLKAFPIEKKISPEYYTLDLLISDQIEPIEKVIDRGRKMIFEGCSDPEIFHLVIDRLVKVDKLNAAEVIIYKAIEKFPNQKKVFLDKLSVN